MHSNAITIYVLKVLFITWNLTKTNFLSKFKNDAMWTNISIFYFLRYNPFFPSAPQSVGCWAESSSCTLPIKAKSKWWAMRCQRLLVVRWWGAVLWRDGAMLRWCGGAVVRRYAVDVNKPNYKCHKRVSPGIFVVFCAITLVCCCWVGPARDNGKRPRIVDYKLIRTKLTIELNLFSRAAGGAAGHSAMVFTVRAVRFSGCFVRSGFINNHYSYKWLTRVTIFQRLCDALFNCLLP